MIRTSAVLLLIAFHFAILACPRLAAEDSRPLLRDDYSTLDHPMRKAQRGKWKIIDATATVKQDDELYKKFQNHGPTQ